MDSVLVKPRRKLLFRGAGSKKCRLGAGTEKSNKIFLGDLRELGEGDDSAWSWDRSR